MVTPFARALALLAAFTPEDRWVGNRELASRSGLPPSTVARIAQSLVGLGYLHYGPTERKYRLAAPVLSLGYGATASPDVQRLARGHMQTFADHHEVHVSLSSRHRLDLIVLESCSRPLSGASLNMQVGTRIGIASSPLGWALLAALPDPERYYLLENVERQMPREWPQLRRRSSEAMAQVYGNGYCTSVGELGPHLGIVATPVVIEDGAPMVLACLGSSDRMTRPRVEREIAPRLLAMARTIRQNGIVK